jgi:SAM-dependent methyltransferase
MAGRAEFAQGTFAHTGIASGSADAVMTVDALQYAPDKSGALAEVARILRPGGRFAFVAFELDADRIAEVPGVWEDPIGDYRPLLETSGLSVLSYDQTPGWEDQVSGGFGAIVAHQADLEMEMGSPAATAAVLEASITLGLHPYRGHVLAVAVRI